MDSKELKENSISSQKKTDEKDLRPIGLAKGLIKVADDFDDPLPDNILNLFY